MNIIELLLRARGASQVKRETEMVRKGIQGLTSVAAQFGLVLGGAAVVGAMARFSTAAIQVTANAQAMQVAFVNMSGGVEAAEANLEGMRQATRGLAHDTDLMQSAQMLLNKNYTDTPEKLERTVYAARRLGAAFRGLSAPQALEWWALMMSGQARMRLNEFGIDAGIVAKRIKEMQKANEGMSRTDAWNIVVMEEAEKLLESLGEELIPDVIQAQADLSLATKDLQLAWGEFVTSPVIVEGLKWMAQTVGAIAGEIKSWSDMDAAEVAAQAFFDADGWVEANEILNEYSGSMEVFQKALIAVSGSHEEYTDALDNFSRAHAATRSELELEAIDWLVLKDAMGDYVDMFLRVAAAQDAFAMAAPAGTTAPSAIPQDVQDLWIELQTDLGQLEADRVAAMAELEAEYQEAITNETAEWNDEREAQLAEFHDREAEIEADYYAQRVERAAQYGLEIRRAEEDHQKQMRRLREDYDIQQEDAIANRDAIAYLRNRRNYEIDRSREEEDHQHEMNRRSEDYALQLAQMEQAYQEQQDARLANLIALQAAEDTAQAARLAELEAARVEELAELEMSIGAARAIRKQEYKDKLHEYIKENGSWSDATQKWFDNEERIRTAAYAGMLVSLEEFFRNAIAMVPSGPSGVIPPLTQPQGPGVPTTANHPPWPGTQIGERAEWGGMSWYWTGQQWIRAYSAGEIASGGGGSSLPISGGSTTFRQVNNYPEVAGQTAEDIVGLVRKDTIQLLDEYSKG